LGPVRGLAILLVVFNHSSLCVSTVRLSPALPPKPLSLFELFGLLFSTSVPLASVTAFMIASGFFMARFNGSWVTAKPALRTLGTRFLIWTLAGYLVTGLLHHRLHPMDMLRDFAITLGPFPAYWFLTVMLCVLAICPWLTRWAVARPKTMLGGILALETVRAAAFYTEHPIPSRIPIEMSFFMLGILLAKHTEPVVRTLGRYRRWIGLVALLLMVAGLAESAYWWNLLHVRDAHLGNNDRLTVRAFTLFATAWILLAPTKPVPSPFNKRMEQMGVKSFGIFVLFDFFQQILYMVCWHGERILGLTDRPRTSPPEWLGHPAMVIPFFAVAVFGPLVTIWAVERYLGKQRKRAIFG
jgi:surface polysaccharide O-acyltransferase-like enzyme